MKKWYVYEDDEVLGPFEGPDLADKIEPDTLVCPAGSEEWKEAKKRPDVKPFLESNQEPEKPGKPSPEEPEDSVAVGDMEPRIDTLKRIARQATAEQLQREFKQFWDEYDRKEQQIIYQEMENLDIIPDENES